MQRTRERILNDGRVDGFATPSVAALVCGERRVSLRDRRADLLGCRE